MIINNPKPLSIFHPLIRQWFTERVGMPTDVQVRAWPEISSNSHVLVTAPTGSGKTLTAFLWAINQLVTGAWQTGRIRILYISPLKALNNDVQRNLLKPLSELREYFIQAGEEFPAINVLTRSGDTPAGERRRMLRHPPEILITTPESLNILLTSKSSRLLLTGIATVILDEIHALVSNKRGTHLITAVDRLVPLSGEFQRIALSATVKPLDIVADFIGGYRITGMAPEYIYEKRRVSIIQSKDSKEYMVNVCFPENAGISPVDRSRWPVLVEAFKKIIAENRSTLFFTNSRRLTEKITRLINENEEEELAYSHHGSLSREIRMVVEQKLKQGELKAIVATNSLELGIDIGELNRVVLIQAPLAISSAIQRIGRSGHGVGQASSGVLYPTHGRDFLEAGIIARCIMDQDIESVRLVECSLDVLAQVILSMACTEELDIDNLYSFIKSSYPYRNLPEKHFNLVLDMLAGRYADTRLRELKPRISIDRIDNSIKAVDGAQYQVFLSGGTIPDRGYFDLRVHGTGSKIGDLDEEFVWERTIGESFALGTQTWLIRNITHNNVEVTPAQVKPGIIPFWRAEEQNRDFHFAEKIALFLEYAGKKLKETDFKKELCSLYYMEEGAADELISFLTRQKKVTKKDLPHRHHLLIEHFDDPMNKSDSKQVILHTIWGGRVNRPFALALAAAWEKKYGYKLEVILNNDCILIMLPHDFNTRDIFSLITHENMESLLRQKLEETGFFGARFRENAGRALLLPKAGFRKRLPLWLNRLRSKKLMDAVMRYEDFPILLETWRTCLQDEFDLENLNSLLDEIRDGRIKITETVTGSASPFADNLIFKQINKFMYNDDTPSSGKKSSLSQELLREVASSSRLRPSIPESLVQILEGKLKRAAPGYAPRSSQELLDWVKERLLIPEDEWKELLTAINRDHKLNPGSALSPIKSRLIRIALPRASAAAVCAVENLPRISTAFRIPEDLLSLSPVFPEGNSLQENLIKSIEKIFQNNNSTEAMESGDFLPEFLQQWLSYYGPVGKEAVKKTLGFEDELFDGLLKTLEGAQSIVLDQFRENTESIEICDRENLEILLRMARRARQPSFKAMDIEYLPLFVAAFQGLGIKGDKIETLQTSLEQLFGFPASVEVWEEYFFPARLEPYYSSWLDSLLQTSDLAWFGCGNKKVSFAFNGDLELFRESAVNSKNLKKDKENLSHKEGGDINALMPDIRGKYTFLDITGFTGMDIVKATDKLWQMAWQGLISNDTFASLRIGTKNRFDPGNRKKRKFSSRWTGFDRWMSIEPLPGYWYALEQGSEERDIIEDEELIKDRVRQLFNRYGILFRELLARELPLLRWSKIFRTLRLMELSGEILSGYFFEKIPGLQFISHEAFSILSDPLPEDSVYWMNAVDPASLCGVDLKELKAILPSRLVSTCLVFHGKKPVIISRRSGQSLDIRVPPDDDRLHEYLSFLKAFLNRDFNPMYHIFVGDINGVPAAKSEYSKVLKEFGFTKNYNDLVLLKRY